MSRKLREEDREGEWREGRGEERKGEEGKGRVLLIQPLSTTCRGLAFVMVCT